MKILCIGDSLGLPRDGCTYEETWLYLLSRKYSQHDFIGQFAGGRLINSALSAFNNCFRYYSADITILQLGICDCAPRYLNDNKFLPRVTIRFFEKIGLESLFWKIVKKHPRRPSCVYTKPDVFYKTYNNLVSGILKNGGRLIIVKIGRGNDNIIKSSPYFNSNVDRYNELLDFIIKEHPNIYVVNPLQKIEEDMVVADNYHCAAKGMEKVFDSLSEVLNEIGLQ